MTYYFKFFFFFFLQKGHSEKLCPRSKPSSWFISYYKLKTWII